ncbi:MAG: S9 family peptidase [Bacteroidia bacterium]|nr:S9 family peptidase [Bacteroidia bacterium]
MKNIFVLIIGMLLIATLTAQQEITLEKIWPPGEFRTERVPGFNFLNDGQHYTRRDNSQINKYDLTTGEKVSTMFDAEQATNDQFSGRFDSYAFSDDEKKIILKTATEQIYRRSSKAFFYVWDFQNQKIQAINPDHKQMYTTFSPDGTKVAYVIENDLYVQNLDTGEEQKVTSDGRWNHIINGSADWVYEEEFSMSKAFWWSPDSKKIAFLRFDESNVKEFTMTNYTGELYPDYETFKYPKVGEDNALVTAHIYNIQSRETVVADAGADADIYYPRLTWTKDPNQLIITKLNRHQNYLQLLSTDAKDGSTEVLLEEKNKYYIDIDDNLTFLEDGKCFIWTSEQDGHHHIYKYNMKGKLEKRLTAGAFDVTSFYGVDEKRKRVYYQAAKNNPMDREVYSVNLNGKNDKLLLGRDGSNSVQFSSTFDFFVWNHSSANEPLSAAVYTNEKKIVRNLVNNDALKSKMKDYDVTPVEFFDFKTSEDILLNGWMIKPPNFDATKEYPLFMTVYGGPGSQTVRDNWTVGNYWWLQMLAQKGYVIVSVDNRGTGARGEEFKKMTYLQLGKYETIDQIEAAKYLGGLDYIDENRIGIFGWSYGGYMSSNCILHGNDVFKAAIAVAPVTNWKWYDTIYTERYMRTKAENEDGYHDNSPVNYADKLLGSYLLVHGGSDDNVHFQHSAEMAKSLISANKQFDTYYYPNRNHGIYGDNARIHLYTKMTNFIEQNLGPGVVTKSSRP